MIIDIPYEQLHVFSCQKCKAEHCRKCKHVWDDIHFGRKCEDLVNIAEERKHLLLSFFHFYINNFMSFLSFTF